MKQLRHVLTLALAIVLMGAPVLAQTQRQTSPQNLQPKTSPDPLVTSPQIVPRQPTTSPSVNPFSSSAPPSASPTTPGSTLTDRDRRLNPDTAGQVAPTNREDCKDWQKHGLKDESACVSFTGGRDRR
jgi:hypothetical protein